MRAILVWPVLVAVGCTLWATPVHRFLDPPEGTTQVRIHDGRGWHTLWTVSREGVEIRFQSPLWIFKEGWVAWWHVSFRSPESAFIELQESTLHLADGPVVKPASRSELEVSGEWSEETTVTFEDQGLVREDRPSFTLTIPFRKKDGSRHAFVIPIAVH